MYSTPTVGTEFLVVAKKHLTKYGQRSGHKTELHIADVVGFEPTTLRLRCTPNRQSAVIVKVDEMLVRTLLYLIELDPG